MDPLLQAAIDEAKLGLSEGGSPIGSVLVIAEKIVGLGLNLPETKRFSHASLLPSKLAVMI